MLKQLGRDEKASSRSRLDAILLLMWIDKMLPASYFPFISNRGLTEPDTNEFFDAVEKKVSPEPDTMLEELYREGNNANTANS